MLHIAASSPVFCLPYVPPIRRSALAGLLPAGVVDGIVCAAGAWQDDLGDGHKGVPLLKQGLDDPGQGLWRVDGRIVEEHDRPRAHPAHHPLGDLVRRDLLPVQAVTIPNSFKAGLTLHCSILLFYPERP